MQQDKKKVEYTLKVVTDGTVDPFTLTTPLIAVPFVSTAEVVNFRVLPTPRKKA